MGQLSKIEDQLIELGFRLVALSPDRPEELAGTLDKNEIAYDLLSDAKMEAAKGFGIAFKLDAETTEVYRKYGIDLAKASGQDHGLLPVPAVFLVTDGKIRFSYVNPDYRVRLDGNALLEAARTEAGKRSKS